MAKKANRRIKKRRIIRPTESTQDYKHTLKDDELAERLKQKKWGKTYLTEFLSAADQNTKITYLNLKGYFEMFSEICDLFDKAKCEIRCQDNDSLTKNFLFIRAAGNFFAAVRLSSSGQLAESFAQLRVCIENALYAFNIHTEPQLAKVWFNRHKDEQSKRESRNKFKPSDILFKLKSVDTRLYKDANKWYNICIDCGAHPNVRSVILNLLLAKAERRIGLELLNTQQPAFELCLTICCLVGICVLEIFALVYENEFKQVNADVRVDNIRQQLQRIAPGLISMVGVARPTIPSVAFP